MSARVQAVGLPPGALLAAYPANGAYADAYATTVPSRVVLAEFVECFYTGRLFKLERWLLARLVARPSTDAEARAVARGERGDFAAWSAEGRTPDQLLMCDLHGRTRSWFMVEPASAGTRLYFGSAVVPVHDPRSGELRMGLTYRALLGFHKLYSRLLLGEAARRLRRPARAALS